MTQHEHCFAAILDRSCDGRVIDYRPISYIGTETPPDTARSDEVRRTDGGILVAITPTAANALVAQLDRVRDDLTAEPKLQRYYYAQRIKLANTLQAQKGRIPTNCVDFFMRAAQTAGIALDAISPHWCDADQVDDVLDVLEAALSSNVRHAVPVEAALRGTTSMHYVTATIGKGTKALYFQTDQNTTLLEAVNSLPPEQLQALAQSAPLGEPGQRITQFQPLKRLEARTTLERPL